MSTKPRKLIAQNVVLTEYVDEGMPDPDRHFKVTETEVEVREHQQRSADAQAASASDPDDESCYLLVELLCLSADPYLRGQIKSTGVQVPGKPIRGFVSGRVAAVGPGFREDEWRVGDIFGANLPFSTVQYVCGRKAVAGFRKLTDVLGGDESKASAGVGLLGMPGSTAYAGLDLLQPKEGETIWVSAAAGAVGGMLAELAKNVHGCKVVGSAGGPEKCARVKEDLGADFAVDYKAFKGAGKGDEMARKADEAKWLEAQVRSFAPDGIDMYLRTLTHLFSDNVGGAHFEAAFNLLKYRGRIAICGGISHYNEKEPAPERIFPMKMIYTNQRIEGFVCNDWLVGRRGNFLPEMAKWWKEGKISLRETEFHGVENWGRAFAALFQSKNVGKVVVRVARL